jgi:hypothetical protein
MELVGALFHDYNIILYYDHSQDNTLELIQNYKLNNSRFEYYINNDVLSPYRTHRISKGRNYCLQQIREKYNDYEYFVMMDCDDKGSRQIKIKLLEHFIKNRNYEWDALSFNYPTFYYDSWALSIRPFVFSCHHFKDSSLGVKYLNRIMKNIDKRKLIPCYSAFNGFAIYKTNKFIDCNYCGKFRLDYIPKNLLLENIRYAGSIDFTQNKEDCEHRFFHFQAVIKNKAKIRISPLCLFV